MIAPATRLETVAEADARALLERERAYDLPGAHVALLRHDLAASLTAHGRALAAHLALMDGTPDAWRLVAIDVDALSRIRRPSDAHGAEVLARGVELMAQGRASEAMTYLAGATDQSVDDYCREVRREMDAGVLP